MTTIGVRNGGTGVAVGRGVAVAVTVGAGVRVGVGIEVGLLIAVGDGTGVPVALVIAVGSGVTVAGEAGFAVDVAVGVLVRFRNSDSDCSGPPDESVHATNAARERKASTANVIRTSHLITHYGPYTGPEGFQSANDMHPSVGPATESREFHGSMQGVSVCGPSAACRGGPETCARHM